MIYRKKMDGGFAIYTACDTLHNDLRYQGGWVATGLEHLEINFF